MKKEPITKEYFEQAEKVIAFANKFTGKIEDRLDYIIHKFFEIYDCKVNTWYFEDVEESEVGNLWDHMDQDYITSIWIDINERSKKYNNYAFIDKFGEVDEWANSIPTRWLFEDFEQEVIDGKKKFEEKELAKKARQKELSEQKKNKNAELVEKAKQKLSKEELQALKRSK